MHTRWLTPDIFVLLSALASCAAPGAPDDAGAATEATTDSTTTTSAATAATTDGATTTSDVPTGTTLAESTGSTTDDPGTTTTGASEGDPQILADCAEGNALQAEMQAWSCACEVEAGDYPTLRACLAESGTTPEEDACTCEVFAADPRNGAFVACQTEAFAAFVACIMPLDCADDGGTEACYAQLGSASMTCEPPAPDVFREISTTCAARR
ncbi:hypothetical protein [Nannocystis sp. SCPEA4]|uniref:hypothetical protein n=1 Tax=Nannocystis sp. SCPEA4 TaxID=2996787 RepID=UPI002270B00D|nr:hypothetical protein [Nannocystis sp. SCPEA4]MCY1059614.1 hypothetical protein [Nannocystis sp. SCPEA4]